MTPERPRSEVIVGTWRTVDGSKFTLHADGSATTDSPQLADTRLLGITLDWRYDDANDMFSLGGSYEGLFFGVELKAQ